MTTFRGGKGRYLYDIISNPERLRQIKPIDFNRKFTERHICYTNEKRKCANKIMMEREEK